MERVPREPSVGQAAAVEVVVVVPETVVVVNWQGCQLTMLLVEPETVAALISDAEGLFDAADDIEITLEANPTSVETPLAGFRLLDAHTV